MKPHELIVSNLDENFSRQDFVNMVAEQTAYSYRHAQNLLQNALHEGLIERTEKRGEYQKCELQEEMEAA